MLSIFDYSGRRPDHLKLGTHILDLGGLLSELGCESLYLFLLLRNRCLQLLNFVTEHGLALERLLDRGRALEKLRCATTLRRATLHRCAGTPARAHIPPKVVVF